MKQEKYTGEICKKFCKFYKPGKDSLACGAYVFLAENLSAGEIRKMAGYKIDYKGVSPDFSFDGVIKGLACEMCEFRADGCDFRDGLNSPPCGGYIALEKLIRMRR